MQRLKDGGFYGAGLVPVHNELLVNRYNEALGKIGVTPTTLSKFSIDGVGWSPEIAAEKSDPDYLACGLATQFVIIVSLEQKGKPIYMPVHSFDFELMEEVFSRYGKQIATITGSTALWLDIDKEITDCYSPVDLFMVDHIKVRAHTVAKIMAAARAQRELVKHFKQDGWMDHSVIQKLIESRETHGDLRFKSIDIPELAFTDVRSFYTRAFGGAFVFRDLGSDDRMLVLEDPARKKVDNDDRQVCVIGDGTLVERLEDYNLVEVPLGWYREHPEAMADIHECLFLHALFAERPDAKYIDSTDAVRKKWRVELGQKGKLPEVYPELERVMKYLKGDGGLRKLKISPELKKYLLRPRSRLAKSLEKVLWQLLVKLQPCCAAQLYTHNKPGFYEAYGSWTEQKRLWALEYLKNRGLPRG